MKRIISRLMCMWFVAMSVAAFAQSGDNMKHDDMKNDQMQNDQMKKDDMKKDDTKKSAKTKKTKAKKKDKGKGRGGWLAEFLGIGKAANQKDLAQQTGLKVTLNRTGNEL